MKEYLYHGSDYSRITELEARSKLHNTDKKVVYLTDNIPYALYYIWDEKHNGYSRKHVTGWIKNGIDKFEKDKDYGSSYEPQKYNYVAIDDDIINDWWSDLTLIKTYFHCHDRPNFPLARWGVTLIPPESLEAFYSIVSKDKRSKSAVELVEFRK